MADRIVKRGIFLYINGKEVTNSFNSINNEMKKIQREQKSMTIGSKEYIQATEDIKRLKSMLKEHRDQFREITKKTKEAANESKSFSQRMAGMADGFNRFAGFIAAGIAGLTGIALAIKKLRDERNKLDSSQANLRALTGLSQEDIDWLTSQAKILSTTVTEQGLRIRQSAQEILDAFTLVGSAKPELLENKEALAETTEEAMRLSSAANIDLKTAVNGLTLALNQYGAGADQAARYTNVLAAGSKMGAVAVGSQTAAIVKAGVSASSANISIEELVATIETLGEKGIKDEVAGTGLKNFFLKLQTGADESNPKIIGLSQSLKNLESLSDSEILKRFGQETYSVAKTLIDGASRVDYFTQAVTGTNIAIEQSAINSQTAAARLAQTKNELKLAGNELVDRINPALIVSTNMLSKAVKFLPGLIDWTKEYGVILLWLVGSLVSYSVAVKAIALYHATWNATLKTGVAIQKLYALAVITCNSAIVSGSKSMVLYNAAIKSNSILLKLTAVATYAFAAAKALLTGNVKAATVAVKLFFTVLKTNPIGFIVSALFTLAGAIFLIATRTTQADKALASFTKKNVEMQSELNKTYRALKATNEGTSQRITLIDSFNRKYGEYLPRLLNEKSTLEDIEKAYRKVSIAMQQKIAAQTLQEQSDEVEKKAMEKKSDELEKLTDIMAISLDDSQLEMAMPTIVSKVQQLISDGFSVDNITDRLTSQIGNSFQRLRLKMDNGEFGDDLLGDVKSQLHDYVKVVWKAADDIDEIRKRLNPFLGGRKKVDDSVSGEGDDNMLGEVVVDASSGGSAGLLPKSGDMEKALASLELYFNQVKAKLKEDYLNRLISQEQYESQSVTQELAYLQARVNILKEFGKDSSQVYNQFLDLQIKEADKKYKELIEMEKALGKAPEEEEKPDDNDEASRLGRDHTSSLAGRELTNEYLYENDLISFEDYQREKTAIAEEHADKRRQKEEAAMNVLNAGLDLASSIFSAMQAREIREIESKYAKEIELAGNNSTKVAKLEEKKEQELRAVKAKYADKQFALQVLSITASTAVAAMNAYSAMASIPIVGPALGIAAAAAASMAGLAQIAQARQAQEEAKSQYYKGGYTEKGGKYEVAGTVHKGEFVASKESVDNPVLRPILDLMDYAQKNNTAANLSSSDIVAAMPNTPISYKSEYSISKNVAPKKESNLAPFINRLISSVDKLDKKLDEPITAVSYVNGKGGMKEAWDKYDKINKNKSR